MLLIRRVQNGKLYKYFLTSDTFESFPVERYDPLEGTWSVCSHMLSPRESAGCAAYMGHIYVAGGKDELNLKLCSAERFDPCEMRWSSVKCMRSKRESVSKRTNLMRASLLL